MTLKWSALPIAARDLLDDIEFDEDDPPTFEIDEELVAKLAMKGWQKKAVGESLRALIGAKKIPKRLRNLFKE